MTSAASIKVAALMKSMIKSDTELALITMKHTDLSTVIDAAEEEIETLRTELSALQTSSSQSVIGLQSQLITAKDELAALKASNEATILALNQQLVDLQVHMKDSNDEVATLTNKNNELTAVKVAALAVQTIDDKTTADASINQIHEEQSKKDRDEIDDLRQQLVAARTKSIDDFATWTKQHNELISSSAAAKVVGDKVIGTLKKQLAETEASSVRSIAELQAQNVKCNEGLAVLKASSEATALVLDRQIEDLQTQLSALQASSSQTIEDLEARLKQANDEASTLTKKYNDLTTAKTTADDQIVLLQNAKDTVDAHIRTLEAQRHQETVVDARQMSEQKTTDEQAQALAQSQSQSQEVLVDNLKEKNQQQMAIIAAHEQEIHRLTSALHVQKTDRKDAMQSTAVPIASNEAREFTPVVEAKSAETANEIHPPPKSQPHQRPSLDRRESSASSMSLAISLVGSSMTMTTTDPTRATSEGLSTGLAKVAVSPHRTLVSAWSAIVARRPTER